MAVSSAGSPLLQEPKRFLVLRTHQEVGASSASGHPDNTDTKTRVSGRRTGIRSPKFSFSIL